MELERHRTGVYVISFDIEINDIVQLLKEAVDLDKAAKREPERRDLPFSCSACLKKTIGLFTSPPLSPSPFHGSTSLTVLSLPKDGEGEISG